MSNTTKEPFLSSSSLRKVWSWVAALLKQTRQGTSSMALIIVCILIPPFFFPFMGLRPTPFNISLKRLMVANRLPTQCHRCKESLHWKIFQLNVCLQLIKDRIYDFFQRGTRWKASFCLGNVWDNFHFYCIFVEYWAHIGLWFSYLCFATQISTTLLYFSKKV